MQLFINGNRVEVATDPNTPLLWVLRNNLGLVGTKFGCGAGYCGACTVQVDGIATRSCVTASHTVEGKDIRTVEGLATSNNDGSQTLHPIQQAFIDLQVPQCSWCMNGQMMTALAFLEQEPNPTDKEIVAAMGNNYCRCGCYVRIKAAVRLAAETMGGAS